MFISNILKVRKEILKLSRVQFSISTGISEHTLRRIEKNQLEISSKMHYRLMKSFEKNGVLFSDNFSNYKIIKGDIYKEFNDEFNNDKRIDSFIYFMKRIYKDICYYKISDDKFEGIYSKYSIVFGNKKTHDYHNYLDKYCLISVRKKRGINKKNLFLRKIKAIERSKNIIEFEKLKGEIRDVKLKIEKIEYVCPIFCVRSYCDYCE